MKNCYICGISGEKVRIFDAIHELRIINLCERCSIIENIPIIKKPNSEQLKESEIIRVSERMRNLTGIREQKKQETFFKRDRLKELEKNPDLEKPEKENLNLINHFYWEIMKNRRRRGLSQKQLAESIGESETAIKMIENSKLPENAKRIINKLEQFFRINLRKRLVPIDKNKPILIDDYGKTLDAIPEDEEMVFIEDEPKIETPTKTAEEISLEHAQKVLGIKVPENKNNERKFYLPSDKDLDIKKMNKQEVTIGDLKKLHEKKSSMIQDKMLEERRKIEERKKMLKESRERDIKRIDEERNKRLIEKEKEEMKRRAIMEQKRKEVQELREKEEKDINKNLGGMELLNNKEDKDD